MRPSNGHKYTPPKRLAMYIIYVWSKGFYILYTFICYIYLSNKTISNERKQVHFCILVVPAVHWTSAHFFISLSFIIYQKIVLTESNLFLFRKREKSLYILFFFLILWCFQRYGCRENLIKLFFVYRYIKS